MVAQVGSCIRFQHGLDRFEDDRHAGMCRPRCTPPTLEVLGILELRLRSRVELLATRPEVTNGGESPIVATVPLAGCRFHTRDLDSATPVGAGPFLMPSGPEERAVLPAWLRICFCEQAATGARHTPVEDAVDVRRDAGDDAH